MARKAFCKQCRMFHENGCPFAEQTVLTEQTSRRVRPPQNPELLAIVERLNRHLASVPQRYPKVWDLVARARAGRGKEVPDWPQWCFLPLAGAYAIATEGDAKRVPDNTEVSTIGALAAWRVTKGIYRFDDTVLEDLWRTKLKGNIPSDVLLRLPAWCCYIPFREPREMNFSGKPNGSLNPDGTVLAEYRVYGFFVHLEHDVRTGRIELRFLFDHAEGLTGLMIHLVGSLEDCVAGAIDEAERQSKHLLDNKDETQFRITKYYLSLLRENMAAALEPVVSLVLYLCSTNAEIEPEHEGYRPKLRHAKRNTKLFAAEEPVIWEVAYRLGKTLRAAHEEEKRYRDQGGTHASPIPHVRDPHWHSFWTGPKAKRLGERTNRELIVKWLPPIPVNCETPDEIIPVVHRVTV